MLYSENDFQQFIKDFNRLNKDYSLIRLNMLKPNNMPKSEYENFLSQFRNWILNVNTPYYYYFEYGSANSTKYNGFTIGKDTYVFIKRMRR